MEVRVRISKQIDIAMAHFLYAGSGVEHCEEIHGHNWIIEATAETLITEDEAPPVLFGQIKKDLMELIHRHFDHTLINTVPDTPFNQDEWDDPWNPTTENFAFWVLNQLKTSSPHLNYVKVTVWENYPNNKAEVEIV